MLMKVPKMAQILMKQVECAHSACDSPILTGLFTGLL